MHAPFLRVWPFGVFDFRNGISFIMVTIPTKMKNVVMAKKKRLFFERLLAKKIVYDD